MAAVPCAKSNIPTSEIYLNLVFDHSPEPPPDEMSGGLPVSVRCRKVLGAGCCKSSRHLVAVMMWSLADGLFALL